jgi:hypothetical protein
MEKTPPTSNRTKKKLAQSSVTATTNSTDKLSLTSTSSSNYQSLDSLISSASRDECDDVNEMPTKILHRINSGTSNGSNGSKGEVEDEVFSSVNPIARLRGIANNSNRRACSSSTSIPYANDVSIHPPPPPPLPPMQQHLQQQQHSRHSEAALLTLLHEMRTVEEQLQQQSATHLNERNELMRQLLQQSTDMKQLQQDNEGLRRENASLKMKLGTILARLDNFATKCWQFNSASVKKMSEALHIQIHEWSAKLLSSDNITSAVTESSSLEEEVAIRSNIMDKLQSMHLEIQNMKRENRELRGKMKRYQKKIRLDDVSDEVSHMSGVTQMTCATSTTTMTTSTTRLMDAMAGFLHEHEGKNGEGSSRSSSSSSSSESSFKKKTIPLASLSSPSPPQSILKSTFKYDNNATNSEQPQGMAKATKTSHNSSTVLVSASSAFTGSGSSDQTNDSRQRPSTQKQVNFANFDNAKFEFQSATDSENHRLTKSWGSREEREV